MKSSLAARSLRILLVALLLLVGLRAEAQNCTASIPLVETFDNCGVGVDVLPSCWARQTNFDQPPDHQPQVVGSPTLSGCGALMLYCGNNSTSGHFGLAIGPRLDADPTTLTLHLSLRAPYSGTTVEVGICDTTDLIGNNFTPVDTLTVTTANVWSEFSVSLASYSGSGRRVALRMLRSLQPSNGLTLYVDDLSVEPCGVWNLTVDRRGTDDLRLSWDTFGSPTVDLEAGPTGSDSPTRYTAVGSPFHLTGLTPATAYTLRLSASCANAASGRILSLDTATLPRNAAPLNFCEDFDNASGNVPDGWLRHRTYGNTPTLSSYRRRGVRSLYFYTYYNAYPMAVLPRIDTVDLRTLQLSLEAYPTTGSGWLVVGVTDYPEDPDSFVPVDTLRIVHSGEWATYTASLDRYTGSGHYLVLMAHDPSSYNEIYVDNLSVARCQLTRPFVTNIGSRQVDLQWDRADEHYRGDSVVVAYGPADADEADRIRLAVPVRGSGAHLDASRQTLTIGNLQPNTDYRFVVYAQCDTGASCQTFELAARTTDRDLTLPYCADFEGLDDGTLPSGWTATRTSNSTPRVRSGVGVDDSRALELSLSNSFTADHGVVALPLFDTDSLRGLTLSFFAYGDVSPYYGSCRVQVGLLNDPADEATFVPVANINVGNQHWTPVVVALDSLPSSGRYLALRAHYDSYYSYRFSCFIDNLVVSDAATTAERASVVSSHAATFSWQGLGRNYAGATVEWGPAGFTRGSGTAVDVAAPALSLTVDTLQAGLEYEAYVVPHSTTSDDPCIYTRLAFAPLDQAVVASYCYGFEESTLDDYPIGWTRPLTYSNTPQLRSYYSHSGSQALCLSTSNCYTPYDAMAVMPLLEESDLQGLTLRLFTFGGAYGSRLTVGFLSDPDDPSTLEELSTLTPYNWSNWEEYAFDLSLYDGSSRYLAFWYHTPEGCNNGDIYLDDITLNRCRATQVRSYSETTTEVTLDWSLEGATDSVAVEYGPVGFASGDGIERVTTDSLIRLTGLAPGTTYEFELRPYCTGSSQACGAFRYKFTTLDVPIADGYCTDFEALSGSLPAHFTSAVSNVGWPYVGTHYDPQNYTSSNRSLEFRAGNGMNLVVLPAADEPLRNLVLTLNLRTTALRHPESDLLIVGVMDNPFDTASFAPVDTLHPSYYFKTYDVSLAAYDGNGLHLALKYIDTRAAYNILYLDDLRLSHCRPAHLRVARTTDHSVTLRFDRLGYTGTTFVEYGPEGFTPGSGTHLHTAAAALTVDDLQPNTSYRFLLWGACADTTQSCQASSLAARTLDEPMAVPVCLTLDGDEGYDPFEHGWTRPNDITTASVSNANHTPLGNHSIQLYASNWNNADDCTSLAAMPALEAETLDGLWLEFYTRSDYPDGISLQAGIMTDPTDSTTFVPLTTVGLTTDWQRHLVSLGAYSDTGRFVAFRTTATYAHNANTQIDDISIRPCAVATAQVGRPTHHSLTLNFTTTAGATGAWVEYKQVGSQADDFEPGSGIRVAVPYSPFTFDELDEASWYAFHIYPNCGDGSDGCSFLSATAQTLHPRIQVPYCENFDLYREYDYPNNWRRHSTYNPDYPQMRSNVRQSEANSLYFAAQDETFSMAIMPQLLVSATCSNLVDSLFASFWTYFETGAETSALLVGVVSDANDPDSFLPLDTLRPTTTYAWEHHTIPIRNIATAESQVAFKLVSLSGGWTSVYVDDLCMEKCVANDVVVSDITQNSVTVTWDSHGVDSILCEYGPRGYTVGSGQQVVLHHSPAVIDNLQDGTEYQFSFASLCGCQSTGGTYFGGGYGGGGGIACCGQPVGWYWDAEMEETRWSWGAWQGHNWSYAPDCDDCHYPIVDTVLTQASFLHIPYCEAFEEYDTIEWPHSWRRIGGTVPGYPAITKRSHHSGENSMAFYATVGSSNYAALAPLEPGMASDMLLTFFAYAPNSNATQGNAPLSVGVMTDPDNASTFTEVASLNLHSAGKWEQYVVDLADYAGSGQYVAFRFAPYYAQYFLFIDDIYLGPCAVSEPRLQTGLHSDLFPDEAPIENDPYVVRLDWESHRSPNQVRVEYGLQGFTPGDTASVGSFLFSSSPVNLTAVGINPDDNYDLYLTALCNDTASGCFTPHVTLNPCLYPPYCEDFESYAAMDDAHGIVPDHWSVVRRHSGRPQYPLVETQHGQQVVAFYPGTGTNDNVVQLPPLPDSDTLEGKWVYACFSTQSAYYSFLDFGFLSDTSNASTFVTMGSMENGASETLRERNIQLTTDEPAGSRLAIRARSTSGDRWLRLAQLALTNYPIPTGLASTPYGASRREIRWLNEYDNPRYTLTYGADGVWHTVESDSCRALLSDLEASKEYTVYFVSPEGERLCLPYTFTTEEQLTLPYCDNFESYERYSVPPLWARTSYDYRPRIEQKDGSQALQFYNGYYSSNWTSISMPDLAVDSLKHVSLRFRLHTDVASNNMIIVGVQESQDDASTFVAVDTAWAGSWHDVNLSLARYEGSGRYVTFRYVQTSNAYHYAYIDNLSITTCPLPDAIVAGSRQIRLQLPSADSTADYWIEYGTGLFEQGAQDLLWNADSTASTRVPHGTVVHVTQNPFFLTGLEPGTTYSLFARCGELDSTCASPLVLTTGAELPMPFCDDFDSYNSGTYQSPTDWLCYDGYNGNNSFPYVRNDYYNSCCNALYFYTYPNYLQYAAMPDLAVEDIQQVELYFKMRSLSNDWENSFLVVGVMDDRTDFTTFTPVDTLYCTNGDNYFPQHVSLSRYTGRGRFVAFRFVSTRNWNRFFIDDLQVTTFPTPTLSLFDASTARAVANNPSGEVDYWIEYGVGDTWQGAVDTTWDDTHTHFTLQPRNRWIHVTDDTLIIAGLEPAMTFSFWTHADSAGLTCLPPTVLTTSVALSLPYCDDFSSYESDGTPPPFWQIHRTNGCPEPVIDSYQRIFFGNYCRTGTKGYVVMPDMEVDSVRRLELTFSMYSQHPEYERIVVGVMSDPADPATFTGVDTVRNTSSYTWQTVHTSLRNYRGDGRFVTFCSYSTSSTCMYMYLDDLHIQACPQPRLQLVGGTTVRSTLPYGSAVDYWLEYGPSEMEPGAVDTAWNADHTDFVLTPRNTLLHVTTDSMLVADLQPNTTYDFYSRCDSAYDASCPTPPTRLTTSSVVQVPYCEDFADYGSGYDAFPTGWKRLTTDGSTSMLYAQRDSDAEDNYDLMFYSTGSRYAYAVLPEVAVDDIRDLSLRLSLWTECGTNPANLFLELGVMDDATDIATFTPVDTLRNDASCRFEWLSASLADYAGHGRFVALRMGSTNNSWHRLYVDRLEVLTCDIPAETQATLYSYNEVLIDAPERTHTGFYVEWDTAGFEQGTGHFLHVATLPVTLRLDTNRTYDFYFRCDTLSPTCLPVQSVRTMSAPLEVPLCDDFEGYADQALPTGWSVLTSSSSGRAEMASNNGNGHQLRLHPYYLHTTAVMPYLIADSLSGLMVSFDLAFGNTTSSSFYVEVGVMSDPYDATTFIPLWHTNVCEARRVQVPLSDAPREARFVAFRAGTPFSAWGYDVYIDNLFVSTCGAQDFHVTEVEATQVTFDWKQVGNPALTLEVSPEGTPRGSGTTAALPAQPPYVLTGLDNLTNYTFYFCATCEPNPEGFCFNNYCDSATVFTPSGGTGCIDPTNLTAEYTSCFYGTFGDPVANRGVQNYGSTSALSRHTVHYDTTERDPRTGNLLRTIPEGSQASVRLGNWASNFTSAEAEAITYSLFVDPSAFDLLVLKYAAVLQDPLHDPSEQPRFSIEILDENQQLIDASCGAANFIANRNLGWNLADDNVLWKDWTTVGIDMSAYAGQTVYIRLTTRDCGEGNHYGYAYFTLECHTKNMQSELCGEVESNRFSAPSGFAYRWYTNLSDETYSTEQSINVPSNNEVTYYCDCSFVDNDACSFTLSAFAGTRYPLARFEYTYEVENCSILVHFNNTSTISMDGETAVESGEGCETAVWDFDNGERSTSYHATCVYTRPGTYNVQLVSGIAGDLCQDTIVVPVVLEVNDSLPRLHGEEALCAGQSTTLAVSHAVQTLWNTGATTPTLSVTPDSTTRYFCLATDSNGCVDTLRHTLTVHPVYDRHDTLELCEGLLPYTWVDTVLSTDVPSGTYRLHRTTRYGCDSLAALTLTVFHNNTGVVFDTILQNELPYAYHDSLFTLSHFETGDDLSTSVVARTVHGCDSTIDFHLHLHRNVAVTEDSAVCADRLPLTWNDSTFAAAGTKTLLLRRTTGADSLLTLSLTVHPLFDIDETQRFCQNALPYTWHDTVLQAGTASGTFVRRYTSAQRCDSLHTLHLVVDTNSHSQLQRTAVENELPLSWNHRTFTAAGTQLDTLENAYGCDSLMTMTLVVFENQTSLVDSIACESQLPLVWNHRTFLAEGTQLDTLTANTGADSVVTMRLTVLPTTYAVVADTIVENQLPYTFVDTTYVTDVDADTLRLTNAVGCDSVVYYSLHVHRNLSTEADSTICESTLPLTWNSRTFTTAGTQRDTLTAVTGADSVVVMHLTVLPTTYADLSDTVVENALPHLFLDHSYVSDTLDTLRLENAAGCDSLLHYRLVVHPNVAATADSTVCESALPFTWNDSLFDGAREVATLLTAHTGADSLLTMRLHVVPTTYHTLLDTVVENQLPYTLHGKTFTDSVAADTLWLTNVGGCDSVVYYSLHVHRNVSATADSTICSSALPLIWNHRTFTAAGTQQDTLTAHTGADSLLTMSLVVLPTYLEADTLHLCRASLPYTWRDTLFDTNTVSGLYTRHHTTVDGCDSICTLLLTIHDAYLTADSLSLCQTALPYTWRDTLLGAETPSGQFVLQRQSVWGCDSTLTLSLAVHPVYHMEDEATLCSNQFPYTYRDTVLATGTASGLFLLHRQTTAGCDSTMQLSLTVNPTDSTVDEQAHCDSYTWQDGNTYTSSTATPTMHYTNRFGCDSTVRLQLTLHYASSGIDHIESCEPIVWLDGNTYSAGNAEASFMIQTEAGCDSLVTLDLRMSAPSTTLLTDSFCVGTQYYFAGRSLTEGGLYTDSLLTVDHCDSIVSLQLTRLEVPALSISRNHSCSERYYQLRANTNVGFLEWSVEGDNWNPGWGSNHSASLLVNPSRTLTFTLLADYFDVPTCPTTERVTLQPIVKPEADIHLTPERITYDQTEFTASDHSVGNTSRSWYVDYEYQGDSRTFTYAPALQNDSVRVMLIAQNELCSDTALRVIPISKASLYAPNAFTPDRGNNRTFRLEVDGVIEFDLYIYTRNGQLVFHSTDPYEAWDGTHDGEACRQASYVWIVNYTTEVSPRKRLTEKGTVTLIR